MVTRSSMDPIATAPLSLLPEDFCELFDLQIHLAPLPTFHRHNDMSESCIVLFAASRGLEIRSISQYCTLETPLNLSSHDPSKTVMSVQFEKRPDGSKYADTYSNFDRKKIVWDPARFQQIFRGSLDMKTTCSISSKITISCSPISTTEMMLIEV